MRSPVFLTCGVQMTPFLNVWLFPPPDYDTCLQFVVCIRWMVVTPPVTVVFQPAIPHSCTTTLFHGFPPAATTATCLTCFIGGSWWTCIPNTADAALRATWLRPDGSGADYRVVPLRREPHPLYALLRHARLRDLACTCLFASTPHHPAVRTAPHYTFATATPAYPYYGFLLPRRGLTVMVALLRDGCDGGGTARASFILVGCGPRRCATHALLFPFAV